MTLKRTYKVKIIIGLKDIIVGGDISLPNVYWEYMSVSWTLAQELVENTFKLRNFRQIDSEGSRPRSNGTMSVLDVCLVNRDFKDYKIMMVPGISDHLAVRIERLRVKRC